MRWLRPSRATLSPILAALIAIPSAPLIHAQNAAPMLNIVIVEGDGAINNIKQRTAREPIVQVEDQNHKPVAGAAVIFALPGQGAGGTFAERQQYAQRGDGQPGPRRRPRLPSQQRSGTVSNARNRVEQRPNRQHEYQHVERRRGGRGGRHACLARKTDRRDCGHSRRGRSRRSIRRNPQRRRQQPRRSNSGGHHDYRRRGHSGATPMKIQAKNSALFLIGAAALAHAQTGILAGPIAGYVSG